MIHMKTGDLLDADELILGHQVNCRGVMGAGLAFQIKITYQEVFNSYVHACNVYGDKNLGNCLALVTSDGEHVIANLFGQVGIGTNERQTNYDALERALRQLHDLAKYNGNSVALPYGLGCGLAGGDWNIVYDMIDNIFQDYEVSIYKLPD